MGPSRSAYRDQGVQGGSPPGSPSLSKSKVGAEEGQEPGCTEHFSKRRRRVSPVYDDYTDLQAREREGSWANHGSWGVGSQALNISTSGSRAMSPYGVYDMDDSSFFAYTTRLNIVGPNSNDTRFSKPRSSSTERLLTSRGERTMSTTATSFQTEEHSRLPSPSPERRTWPTESYLKLSLQPSLPLADPTASRKLLVLDLNGTLLLRSAHSRDRAPAPSYSRVRQSADTPSHPKTTPSSLSNPYPTPRTVYLRPYLPSFRAYLFHPNTLQWLDTMVWSSAQPHSVNDMVHKCFGTDKEGLKAIWARDTLGLIGNEYYRKTQTTKDLEKPWALIPSVISDASDTQPPLQPPFASHPSGNPSSEAEVDKDNHASLQHSALTTLLMDDSPLKAVLQPWNHLCVSEYGKERRKLDVEIAEQQLELMLLEREKAIKPSDVDNTETERTRKRQEKKKLKKEKLLLEKEQQLEAQRKEENGKMGEERYDELLLAVIGIIDELKLQGNVAGWMRSGGLVHVGDQETILESNTNIDSHARTSSPTSENSETTIATTTMPIANLSTTITSTSPPIPSAKRDGPTSPIQGPSKRRRLNHLDNSSDNEMESPVSTSTSVAPSTPTLARNDPISTESPTQSQPLLWYEIPSVLSYWAQHGRKALGELGIEVVAGVVPPNQNGNGQRLWGSADVKS